MSIFVWDDSYRVGVAVIDEQHRNLVKLLNELHDAMAVGKAKEVLGHLFSELLAYTQYHFTAEETLMREHHYPGFAEHHEEHKVLTQKALELQKMFQSGSVKVTFETSAFLRGWLSHHIQGIDKQVGVFLNAKGVR